MIKLIRITICLTDQASEQVRLRGCYL